MAPVISILLTKFANSALRSQLRDDDVVDQLNHWATTGVLTALALGIGAKQYVGEPIHCWIPAEYKSKHYQKYSDSYCWIHPMYSFSFDDTIPFRASDRWVNDIGFYRWVFIMFLLQAFLFKLPNILWKHLKEYSGLNISKVVGMALETQMMPQDKREEKIDHIAIFIDRWLKTYSQYKYNVLTRFRDKVSQLVFCLGKRSGTYLHGLYMFVKLLYFANIVAQFFILSNFLDLNFWSFGFSALSVLRKQGFWQDHYHFPRIGLCDYRIRQLQNIQTFTVQCVLSINLFLEKMYLIVWFWMMFMLAMNSLNLAQWIFRGLRPHSGEAFLNKYLLLLNINSKQQKKLFVKFVVSYLRPDGVFMLRMVAVNTSEILTLDLVKHLWDRFKKVHGGVDEDNNEINPNGDSLPASPSAPVIEDNASDSHLKKVD